METSSSSTPVLPVNSPVLPVATPNVSIPKFEQSIESIECYMERLNFYFTVTNTPDNARVPLLCLVLGPEHYKLLREALSPRSLTDCSYSECTDILLGKFTLRSCVIANRFKFYTRKQQPSESISDFINCIKSLSMSCNFDSFLDQALRDKLVCGINNDQMIKRLLSEEDSLTFQQACTLLHHMESVSKSADQIQNGTSYEANAISHSSRYRSRSPSQSKSRDKSRGNSVSRSNFGNNSGHQSQKRCSFCSIKHQPDRCPALQWSCYSCGKKGHTSSVCRRKPGTSNNNDNKSHSVNLLINQVSKVQAVTYTFAEDKPLGCYLIVNSHKLYFLVDSGSSVSVISNHIYEKYFKSVKLIPYNGILLVANKSKVDIIGTIFVTVCLNNEVFKNVQLIIVKELTHDAIMGRDMLDLMVQNWRSVFVKNTLCSLSSVPQSDLESFKIKFPNAFSAANNNLAIKNFQVSLNLKENATPVFHRAYTVPFALRKSVDLELDRLEAEGIIKRVKYSQWASPLVCIPKKSGQVRLCVDFKTTVNPQLRVDQYPIPNPDDIINEFLNCAVYCEIDLSNAFLQVEVSPESRHILTVNTSKGLYEYCRLCFGLSSAPAAFQSVIDSILSKVKGKKSAFFDNIFVGGKTYEECAETLSQVLEALNSHNVKINVEKSRFFVNSLDFLGFKLSKDGKQPSESKIQKIRSAPTPTNISQLKSYLSMLNFYRCFIPMCPDLLNPLHQLLKKDVPFVWSQVCEDAFVASKQAVSEKALLVLFDPTKPISVTVDSSSFGVGAVLSNSVDGKDLPVIFESATLTPAQQNYSQIDKEALAVIFAITKFHKYLIGNKFTIYSDHQSLKTLFSESKKIPVQASSRLIRWSILLSAYDYKIEYKKGISIPQADAMSRLPSSEIVNIPECNFLYLSTPLLDYKSVAEHTSQDTILSQVKNYIEKGWSHYRHTAEIKKYFNCRHNLSVSGDCIIFGNRVVIPSSLQMHVLQKLHYGHSGITRTQLLARSYIWWSGMDESIREYISRCDICRKTQNSTPNEFRSPWPSPTGPWQRIHLDFFYFKGTQFLILADSYTKWIECVRVPTTKFGSVSCCLNDFFSRFSYPKMICTDNGPPFSSEEFGRYCSQKNIKLIRTPSYNPQSNGLSEKSVSTFKRQLYKSLLANVALSIEDRLSDCLLVYRATPSSVTGVSPMSAMLSYSPRTPISQLVPSSQPKSILKCPSQLSNTPKFCEDERVLVNLRHAKGPLRWESGVIKVKVSQLVYIVQLDSGTVRKVHVNQVRKYDENKSHSKFIASNIGKSGQDYYYHIKNPQRLNPVSLNESCPNTVNPSKGNVAGSSSQDVSVNNPVNRADNSGQSKYDKSTRLRRNICKPVRFRE